jgi:glycosyltransferase involved in cell wall biosynthesis
MKVLISAYACEPDKGSEPGAGWHWVVAAAREHEVCVLTRTNNRTAIEACLASDHSISARFVYLDLPRWARFWKQGSRGLRLYYALWQALAMVVARRLNRTERFDVVHHLTFANVWLPALTCFAGPPFLLGPVGGGPRVPPRLYGALGMRGVALELWLQVARTASRFNPVVRVSWRRAYAILVQNEETLEALPSGFRSKCAIRPNAATLIQGAPVDHNGPDDSDPPSIVCAGRLLPWKGVSLAISMMDHLPAWELTIVGDGPDRRRLEQLAQSGGMADRVRFLSWLPQAELWTLMEASRCLLLPSLREDASLIVAESQALGVPVVAFDRGGPRILSRLPGTEIELVPLGSSPGASARRLAEAVAQIDTTRPNLRQPDLGIDGIARDISVAYDRAVTRSRGDSQAMTFNFR